MYVSLSLRVFKFSSASVPRFNIPKRFVSYAGKDHEKQNLLKRWWNSWVPIPTGVGLTLLAVLQWRRLEKERNKGLKVAKDWEITCYRAIPLRSLSRFFGWFSSMYIPFSFRPVIFNSYSRVFGVNTSEMAKPVEDYDCLCSFFTRELKNGCRPIDCQLIVSPADGTVLNIGRLTSCQIDQVKGVTYNIKAFLGDVTWPKATQNCKSDWEEYKKELLVHPENELYQCVVYLAPGDYHRFHSPVHWSVNFRRHFQGELLSVNPRMAGWIPGLFTLNERAVYTGCWEHGYFSMTAVGATNVGSIRVYDDKTLHTNEKKWKNGVFEKELKLKAEWKKGEEVGQFRMGSTIVLIWEAPRHFELALKAGDRVRVGQRLCRASVASSRQAA